MPLSAEASLRAGNGDPAPAIRAALDRLEQAVGDEPCTARFCAALAGELSAPVEFVAGPVGDGAATAVVAADRSFGWLVVAGPLDAVGRAILEQAAPLLAIGLVRERALAKLRNRRRAALLSQLLTGDVAGASARGRALGVDLNRPLAVGFAATDDPEPTADFAEAHAEALVAPFGDGVLVAWPEASPSRLRRALGTAMPGRIGVAAAPVAASGLRDAVAAARSEATREPACGGEGMDRAAAAFARETLRPAVEHDRARGDVLVPTARAYLAARGNLAEAARRVGVHVNTLRDRLARLSGLGIDLDDAEVRFGVDLALRLDAGPLWTADELAPRDSSASPLVRRTGET